MFAVVWFTNAIELLLDYHTQSETSNDVPTFYEVTRADLD